MAAANKPWWRWLLVAAVIVVLDQYTKTLVLREFQLHDSRFVTSYFNLVRAHNTGAAFNFLAGAGGWQRWFFVGLAAAATGVITWMLRKHGEQTLFATALTCILGGAVGNVVDRLLHGYVVDFLQFHWHGAAFPSFNLADSAITLGAALLILDELRRVKGSR